MVDESIKEFCFSCGNEKEDQEKNLCDVCNSLAKEEFHHIPTKIKAIRYAKKYLKKNLNYKERRYINDLYKDKNEDHVIGTMPSQCPFCFRLSKNQGEFTFFKKDSEEYKRHVEKKEKLMAVCTPCGGLAHFLKEFYDLNADEINAMLKNIKKIKDKRKNVKN